MSLQMMIKSLKETSRILWQRIQWTCFIQGKSKRGYLSWKLKNDYKKLSDLVGSGCGTQLCVWGQVGECTEKRACIQPVLKESTWCVQGIERKPKDQSECEGNTARVKLEVGRNQGTQVLQESSKIRSLDPRNRPALWLLILCHAGLFITNKPLEGWVMALPSLKSPGPLSSVQFSCSVMSDSLQPHEPQHARPPCSSPTPGVHPNPCPSSQWYHPAISSSGPLGLPNPRSSLCPSPTKLWTPPQGPAVFLE